MIALLAALVIQAKEPEPIILPPGSSEAFQSTVFAVQAAVEAGDWDEAKRLAARLPDYDLTVEWDDSLLDATQKADFLKAREAALAEWQRVIKDLKVTFKKGGELKVSFAKELPPNVDTVGPAGAVFFDSPGAGEPVIEAVIALARTSAKRPISALEALNEIQYAFGAALGLARFPRPPSPMFRSEDLYPARGTADLSETRLVGQIVDISNRIRKEVAERKDPKVGKPQIFLDPVKFTPAPVGQYEAMPLTMQITNQGTGTLEYRLVPDCGCFIIGGYQKTLAPGQTTVVDILINTIQFTGKLNKVLFVYSNDPQAPIKQVPLETVVRPAYRFVPVNDEPVLYLSSNGAKYEAILVVDEGHPFNIKDISVAGVNAQVSKTPWTGTLDWPEIGEGPKPRKGFLITALVSPTNSGGRVPMQIQVETDDQYVGLITHSINVQKGIASVPQSIYFGQVAQMEAKASVLLTRPGRPFKVLRVESDTEFVTASFEHFRDNSEYRITATFSGKAPFGRFAGKVTVYTDDAEQPTVVIPVEGNVR